MNGKTVIHESVFAEIAQEAMHSIEDVFKQDKKGTFAGLTKIFTGRFAPQITVKKTDSQDPDLPSSVSFEVKLGVIYGVNIPEVAKKVREKIASDVENMTGYTVERIDINIDRIIKPDEVMADKKEEN